MLQPAVEKRRKRKDFRKLPPQEKSNSYPANREIGNQRKYQGLKVQTRSRDRSGLWDWERHFTMKTFFGSHMALWAAITAAKRKSGSTCSSVCSPKWGQYTVNSQRVWDSGTVGQKEKAFVYVTKWVPACDVVMGKRRQKEKQLGSGF